MSSIFFKKIFADYREIKFCERLKNGAGGEVFHVGFLLNT